MTIIPALEPHQLYRVCDPDQFSFDTTADVPDLTEIIGQARALEAVRFGSGIQREGYNLFVLGSPGMGKHSLVQQFLETKTSTAPEPFDWCYLNNFAQPHKPKVLKLPSGMGEKLRLHMERLVDYLRSAIPAQFESEEYRNRLNAIQQEYSEQQEREIRELGEEAEAKEIILLRTPEGFALAPSRNHEVIPPEEYDKLPQAEKDRIEAAIAELQTHLEKILSHLPMRRRERGERIKQLNRDTMLATVEHMVNELRIVYVDQPDVLDYLEAVQQDMVMHVEDFRKPDESINVSGMTIVTHQTFNKALD